MFRRILLVFVLLCVFLSPALASTRALLIACSDFSTFPDLGSEVSGNLHMIGSALLGAREPLEGLSIEDGTIGSCAALRSAIQNAFSTADENDLSILYICTHGVLSSSDDSRSYLLLGDGQREAMLGAQELYEMISGIQGEKLLILDACYSGAFIGHGAPSEPLLPGARPSLSAVSSPFLTDSSVSVLTSASGDETGWYFDSDHLSTGAVSYFASALSTGIGLYGKAEADMDGSGTVSLGELYRYLRSAVPSSSVQIQGRAPDALLLPTAQGAMLSRPLSDFSYGSSLLPAEAPYFDFSFTVTRETAIQYRLVEYAAGGWDWEHAVVFADDAALLTPGRKIRTLTLPSLTAGDSGYLMLQIFSLTGGELILCSERLLAIQPSDAEQLPALSCGALHVPGSTEMPIRVALDCPASLTLSVYDEAGALVRRIVSGMLTRPGGHNTFYWDGTNAEGETVPAGEYVLALETTLSGVRRRITQPLSVDY